MAPMEQAVSNMKVHGGDHDLTYRAEGNCSIVVASSKKYTVYRLLKADASPTDNQYENMRTSNTNAKCKKIVQYATEVMTHLIGSYMTIPIIMKTGDTLLRKLRVLVEPKRPVHRRHKSIAECHILLAMPDLAYLPSPFRDNTVPTFTFEIKPKSNICFTSRSLQDDVFNDDYRSSEHHCYFCQSKSRKTSRDVPACRYCPQDLYSGNIHVMENCIKHLLEDVNFERSRLRFFKDGEDLTSSFDCVQDLEEEITPYFQSAEEAVKILVKCLIHQPYQYNETLDRHHRVGGDDSCISPGSALSVLENAQSYGWCSISKIKRAYRLIMEHAERDRNVLSKLCVEGPYDTGMWNLAVRPVAPSGVNEQLLNAFIMVRNHLIFRSCKDCSVLISLQPGVKSTLHTAHRELFKVVSTSGQPFTCQVKIIDLDPKPFSKMASYIKSVECE